MSPRAGRLVSMAFRSALCTKSVVIWASIDHRLKASTFSSLPQVALVACMRKLLTIINAMLKHQTPWNPTVVHHA